MIQLNNITNVYFVGAGGIGMSAIERFFLSRGVKVSGYDKTNTVLTKQLLMEGALIHFEDSIDLLDKDAQLVVYTPAVPKDHQELNWYRDNGYEVVKRSDVLQIITADSFNICIGGTHGKTTISSMVGHVLRHTGFGCNAFLGGIAVNYNSNFWSSENNVCVVEADEYDRSFHKLSPDIAVLTAMDPDHLDIYGTAEAMQDAFVEFAEKTKSGGLLIRRSSLTRLEEAKVDNQLTYGLYDADADVHVISLRTDDGSYWFDVNFIGEIISDFNLNVGGLHNVENVLVAIAIAKQLGIEDNKIKAAVAAFKGVKRRFEYVLKGEQHIIIDDYAHHPEELNALISGARSVFPHRKLTIVFQPHLFSRTRDLADGFAAALDKADQVIILPIYPARELPMEGVTSNTILGRMENESRQLLEKDAMLKWMTDNKPELLIMAGAGDIDSLVKEVKERVGSGE
ncbi:MAG: UDP-N-acetylmuramate--L-alanine ligase [Chitinophagaceae bacterium]